MNEIELLEGAQNNDQRAFKEIFKRNKTVIYYMIYQMVNDTYIAEDLTMETFEKAFREIKKFVPRYKLISWITKIGKNLALDYIRAQSIRPRSVNLDYMMQERYNNNYNPEHEFIGKEQEQILETAISHLNGNYRKITMLRMEGKKCKDIAQELNVPINTVVGYIGVSKRKMLEEQIKVGRIKIEKPDNQAPIISLKQTKNLRKIKTEEIKTFRNEYIKIHKTYKIKKRKK